MLPITELNTDGIAVGLREEQQQKYRDRKNITARRRHREEVIFQKYNELTTDFKLDVYLLIQHYSELGMKKWRQIYNSYPDRDEMPSYNYMASFLGYL